MLNENAKKWVAALRSGKYQQFTGGALRNGDAFCCLGVACDVAIKNGFPLEVSKLVDAYHYDGKAGILPLCMVTWLGLTNGSGGGMSSNSRLTRLNDIGTPFSEIAALIESEPKGLFVKGAV